jgi:hypothetical protein
MLKILFSIDAKMFFASSQSMNVKPFESAIPNSKTMVHPGIAGDPKSSKENFPLFMFCRAWTSLSSSFFVAKLDLKVSRAWIPSSGNPSNTPEGH